MPSAEAELMGMHEGEAHGVEGCFSSGGGRAICSVGVLAVVVALGQLVGLVVERVRRPLCAPLQEDPRSALGFQPRAAYVLTISQPRLWTCSSRAFVLKTCKRECDVSERSSPTENRNLQAQK